jgi:ketosteroid isomerase-like protein
MSVKTVMNFVKAINAHQIKKIGTLMTDDHTFINSHGKKVVGKSKMKEAWKGYFDFFPDYTIEVTEIIEDEELIGLFGWATGTYRSQKDSEAVNTWKLPCAWKAVVKNEKIAQWQVYSDTKIPYDIIERNLRSD